MGLGRSVATSAGIFGTNNPSRGHQRAGVKTFFPYKTAKTPPIDCSRRADSNKMADGRMRSFFLHDFRVAKFYFLALVRCTAPLVEPPAGLPRAPVSAPGRIGTCPLGGRLLSAPSSGKFTCAVAKRAPWPKTNETAGQLTMKDFDPPSGR